MLSKKYKISRERSALVKSTISWIRGKRNYKDLWALNNIKFNVFKGQTVGIIGKNGSGKTTILKIIAGITKPTNGEAKVNGRVSSLLELGAGFQGELTGRENIYLNASILGASKKEIDKKIEKLKKEKKKEQNKQTLNRGV